jgi:glyoxylase-like metal-dependent hydrolase (beta-lactamase superfamily II)
MAQYDLYTITLPTPFPVGPINVYLGLGGEVTLLDTGPNDPATLETLRAGLAERGLGLRDIRRIIVTHAHVDHFGLAAQIVTESGALVLSHPRNRWWLTDFERERERRYDFYEEIFARSGVPSEYAHMAIQGMSRLTMHAASVPESLFVPIEEGAWVTLGKHPWQVLYAPGHASGLICLFDPRTRTLISSDHLLRDITSNPVLEAPGRGEAKRPRALVDYLNSMEKTARLDVRMALPAHGDPIYDVRALVDARIAFHRSRLNHIEQQLECCAQTAYEICNILFPDLSLIDTFLGLSEVIGHLDVLEAEGRVVREEGDGLTRYVPTKQT